MCIWSEDLLLVLVFIQIQTLAYNKRQLLFLVFNCLKLIEGALISAKTCSKLKLSNVFGYQTTF